MGLMPCSLKNLDDDVKFYEDRFIYLKHDEFSFFYAFMFVRE